MLVSNIALQSDCSDARTRLAKVHTVTMQKGEKKDMDGTAENEGAEASVALHLV
jgi:hypothetical protein